MGGKSRKSGTVSKSLIRHIKQKAQAEADKPKGKDDNEPKRKQHTNLFDEDE